MKLPTKLNHLEYPYQREESNAAYEEWGMNCGPGAFATMLNLKPADVRPIFDQIGFPEKRYTNAVMMSEALDLAGVAYQTIAFDPGQTMDFGDYTLCRIQWHGPWTAPGVPVRARLRKTHWVGQRKLSNRWIFDINAGWQKLLDWHTTTVPEILENYKRANGDWSITHRIELFI